MSSSGFDRYGLDGAGIHWMQYLAMTSMSLMIFLISLDKAVPQFHDFLITIVLKLQCSGLNCNGFIR